MSRPSTPIRQAIVWGGTGQAKVVRPIVEMSGIKIIAVFDDTPGLSSPFDDVPILHGQQEFQTWVRDHTANQIGFIIAIGNPHGQVRLQLHDWLMQHGLSSLRVIDRSAVIAANATIGEGCQIHPGAIIMPEARIGRQVIVNTKSSIDHECDIGDGAEVGPGATLCGDVRVGEGAWVGAGATVLPRVRIGPGAIVGAGALVRHDVPAGAIHVGVPARCIETQERS